MIKTGKAIAVLASLLLTACSCTVQAQVNFTALSNLRLNQIGGGDGSDIWGWTDSASGRQFALMGRSNGTAFVEITDGANPVYLGNLPSHTGSSAWRDIKVYSDHAYIVSDSNGPHGLQIFDLSQLLTASPNSSFSNTAHFSSFRSAHNIAINEDSGYAYIVGSNQASGGLHMIDLSNPTNPSVAGNFSSDGYTHDVQVVNYTGPDADYAGREIAFASNEDTLTIVDVTTKSNPMQIDKVGYPNTGYAHQGWLTEDQRYFFMNDELDEFNFGGATTTKVFDVANLDNPVYLGNIVHGRGSIDHNLYIKGNCMYQANYSAGLRVFEIQNAGSLAVSEVASWDTFPSSDGRGFGGAWSVYPYFDDNKVIVSDINSGLFVGEITHPGCLVDTGPEPGDFNDDGEFDCADIDALIAAIAGGNNPSDFDMTGDGVVDNADRDEWLMAAGAAKLSTGNSFLMGDANLDGVVDTSDLNIWNGTKFTQTAAWCDGDFNADGVIDTSDLNIWSSHKFQSAGTVAVSAVPEPASLAMLLTAVLSCWGMRRRR